MRYVALAAMAMLVVVSHAAADLLLVEDGKPLVPIVIFKDAPPFTRQAADELARYIEKSSGAKMQVIEGMPQPIPEKAIWVGHQPVLKQIFPEVDFDFKHPEEILIAANDKHLVIAGRDRWVPGHLDIEMKYFVFGNRDVQGFQLEYGTVNAVYTFLQDHLGVRWLWPGPQGEDVPRKDTISLAPFEYRYHPQIRQRHSILPAVKIYRQGGKPGAPAADWARRQRMQLDSLYSSVQGHGFGDWWGRFSKDHPEYFALQPDGTRSGFPGPKAAKICESNPAVWKQWLADVEALIEKAPTRTVFSAAANDSWTSGHCVCDNCRAWDSPDAELRRFHWKGLVQEYVALSDRQVTFANHLGRLLKERFPDKDYRVVILAYGNSRPAPKRAVPDDNVIIGNVANCLADRNAADRASPTGVTHFQQFKDWSRVTPTQIWRPNVGNVAGWQQGGPVDITGTAETFRLMAENGCIGINVDNVWMYWATQGPLYYLMAQLAWNPYQDAQALMDDYHRRGFGPGAEPIKAYWTLLEKARNDIAKNGKAWKDVFDGALFEEAEGLLRAAGERVTGQPAIYAERIAFVAAGLEFLRLQTENRALVSQLKQRGGGSAETYAKAKANWDRIVEISKKHPLLANQMYTLRNPPGHLGAIYPEIPGKK